VLDLNLTIGDAARSLQFGIASDGIYTNTLFETQAGTFFLGTILEGFNLQGATVNLGFGTRIEFASVPLLNFIPGELSFWIGMAATPATTTLSGFGGIFYNYSENFGFGLEFGSGNSGLNAGFQGIRPEPTPDTSNIGPILGIIGKLRF